MMEEGCREKRGSIAAEWIKKILVTMANIKNAISIVIKVGGAAHNGWGLHGATYMHYT